MKSKTNIKLDASKLLGFSNNQKSSSELGSKNSSKVGRKDTPKVGAKPPPIV